MRYEPATRIGTGPTPGARALEAWFLAHGFGTAGIYNPRTVAGTSTLSLHAEGRALDATPGGRPSADLSFVVDLMVWFHAPLGLQQVIWQRAWWRCDRTGWHRYSGVDPHTGHAHLELSRAAADGLTIDTIDAVMAPGGTVATANRLDVVVRGADNAVWHRFWDNAAPGWSPWECLGGVVVGSPSAAWLGDAFHVFVRGDDNRMWQRVWNPAGGWSDWMQHHDADVTGGPFALTRWS